MQTANMRTGRLGEDIACAYLVKKGFSIQERNYWKPWGEIDIVAQKGKSLHFIEVKTVTHENAHGTLSWDDLNIRPEENVHGRKLDRLRRIVQSYLAGKRIGEGSWRFDVLCVLLDPAKKQARIRFLENITL